MTNHLGVKILQRDTGVLVMRQHRHDQMTTLTIIRRGEELEIHTSIEKEHSKRKTYMSSSFCCGPDIAAIIAEACTKGVFVPNRAVTEHTEVTHAAI